MKTGYICPGTQRTVPCVPALCSVFLWHHPPDGHMLQEINADIHNQFTHIGGIAKNKKGE